MGTRNAKLTLLAHFTGILSNILNATKTPRPLVKHELQKALTFTQGTGEGQCNFIWGDTRQLAGAATEDLDLFDLAAFDIGAGAGKDGLGQSVALAELVALFVHVRPESVGRLAVGGKGAGSAFRALFRDTNTGSGTTSDPDDAAITVESGGILLVAAPKDPAYVISDATDHLLQMMAVGGAVTYDVLIAGRTA